MAKKVKRKASSRRFPIGYKGPPDADVIIQPPRRKPPKGPKSSKGGGKGSVGFSNGKRPETPKGKKDPGGFASPGFKSEGFQSGKKTPKTGPPPSVRAREEKRAKQPPPVKYGGKKKKPPTKFGEWHWGDIDPPKRPRRPKKPMKPAKKKARKK